ncbi:alpha/beta fold hydrolase [Mucilaginibacter sp. AK015]|uniref:alpha/beta fold hydrolase n=1 Tax=Mucilaginibacter sp. AK015 TaxID=2723072 RepID=UPI00160CBF7E|nr:alpha/beta hydrolase [Mucilaginibacter sp. AK015]MBB5394979.1 pimeloyl-ACP methyl ester carboxylesterase [Mucilaginibacter sp. AK015]
MKRKCLLLLPALCLIMFGCSGPSQKSKNTAPVSLVSNGVRIDYTDTGNGDTTLLFVHGWCINKSYWADQVAYFGKKYRVVTIDLPGFGKSGRNRTKWNTAAYGQDIKNVIDQLGLKNVVLVGHSMAGNIVLQGAVDAPENVIALVGVDNFKSVGQAPVDSVKYKQEYGKVLAALRKDFKAVAFEWFNKELFYKTTTKAIRDRILNDVAHADQNIAIATQEWDSFNDTDALLKAKKKLYLVNSDYQPTDTTGLVAKKIPYKLYEVHATGHFPMVEKPQEFNLQLAKAIADIKQL